MKKGLLKIVNVYIDGNRTSITLTPTQLSIARELADFRDMSLKGYLEMLIRAGTNIDKRYSRSEAARDGIIMELHTLLMGKTIGSMN